jgi:hypothetical protein
LFDDEVISLLYLGKPRDAMMLRAPWTEALDEGIAQKGFDIKNRRILFHPTLENAVRIVDRTKNRESS